MTAKIDEIGDGIFRLSVFVPRGDAARRLYLQSFPDSRLRNRCCFIAASARCFPSRRSGRENHAGRKAALGELRPFRGRRMRRHERMARCRAACRIDARHDRRARFARRHGRPAAAHADRRRGHRHRRQAHPLHRHAACAARLGCRRDFRGNTKDTVRRRPVRALRQSGADDAQRDCQARQWHGNDSTYSTSLGPITAPTIRKLAELKSENARGHARLIVCRRRRGATPRPRRRLRERLRAALPQHEPIRPASSLRAAACGSIRCCDCAGWPSSVRLPRLLVVKFGFDFELPMTECLVRHRGSTRC